MKIIIFCVILCIFSLTPLVLAGTGGIFTVNCAPLTTQRSDPIVNPHTPGTHTHVVIGGNAFSRNMDDKFAAFNANATTCDKKIDHSNYWVPALYHMRTDGLWELVPFGHAAVYYLKRACDYDPANPTKRSCDSVFNAGFLPLAFPDGFRMVAGDPARRTQNNTDFAQKAVEMVCLNGDVPEGPGFPKSRCSSIRAQVFFPSCWNGKDVDTPDHHSHVAYPAYGDYNTGVCPQSHPKAIISIFFEFFFHTDAITDYNRFAWANGDATGYGYHGDFVMGWTNRTLLQSAWNDCISAADCPTLGNKPMTKEELIYPAIYEEEVGLNGPIPKLPGNNPVVWPTRV